MTESLGGEGIIADQNAPLYQPIDFIPPGYSYVVFYRPYSFYGSAVRHVISINEIEHEIMLVNDSFWHVYLPSGKYSITSTGLLTTDNKLLTSMAPEYPITNLEYTINSEQMYFLATSINSLGALTLESVKKGEALIQIENCRQVIDTVSIDSFLLGNIEVAEAEEESKEFVAETAEVSTKDETITSKPVELNTKPISGSTNLMIDRSSFPIVTVFDFQFEGISEMEAKFIVDFLGGALFDTGKYRLLDRNQRERILTEIEFSLSGCSDEACQLEVGKLLSADYMVVGSLGKIGTRFMINSRLIEIESGETMLSARDIYDDMDAMIDGCTKIASKLIVY